jgi:hypothetical protein
MEAFHSLLATVYIVGTPVERIHETFLRVHPASVVVLYNILVLYEEPVYQYCVGRWSLYEI